MHYLSSNRSPDEKKICVLTISSLSTGLARSRHKRAFLSMSGDHRPAGTRLRSVRISPNPRRMASRITYSCRPPRACRRVDVREQGRCRLGSLLALRWEDWVDCRLSDRRRLGRRRRRVRISLPRRGWARLETIARRRTMRHCCLVSGLDRYRSTFPTSRRRSRAAVRLGRLSSPRTGRRDGRGRLRWRALRV